jgi:hypothetical protein
MANTDLDLQHMIIQIEEEFTYLEDQCLKNEKGDCDIRLHAIAMITLYHFALNLKLSGSQLIKLLYLLDKKSRLHRRLIAPYLMLLDDMELVCKQYGHAYLLFLSEIAQNKSDEEIMEVLFKRQN